MLMYSFYSFISYKYVANQMENFDRENIDELLEIHQIRQYFPRQILRRMVFMHM